MPPKKVKIRDASGKVVAKYKNEARSVRPYRTRRQGTLQRRRKV